MKYSIDIIEQLLRCWLESEGITYFPICLFFEVGQRLHVPHILLCNIEWENIALLLGLRGDGIDVGYMP